MRYLFAAPTRQRILKAPTRRERTDNFQVRRELRDLLAPQFAQIANASAEDIEGFLVLELGTGVPDPARLIAPQQIGTQDLLLEAYESALNAGAQIGARHTGALGGLAINADRLSDRISDWILTTGATRIDNLNAAQLTTVRTSIDDVLRLRETNTQAAKKIGQSIGLTPQQARALRKFEADAIERRITRLQARARAAGQPQEIIDRIDNESARRNIARSVDQRRERMLRQRGQVIIETELQEAIQAGEQMHWQQLAEDHPDRLDLDRATKTWFTVNDLRVCPICEPLHDVTVPFASAFTSTGGRGFVGQRPPAHPRCRCFLTYDSGEVPT